MTLHFFLFFWNLFLSLIVKKILYSAITTKNNGLEMSWGAFFAKKSPPMGNITGTSTDGPFFSSPNIMPIQINDQNTLTFIHFNYFEFMTF